MSGESPYDESLRVVEKEASARGYRVIPAVADPSKRVRGQKPELLMNGRRCRISNLRSAPVVPGTTQRYARTFLSREAVVGNDFLIVYQHPPGCQKLFFIIPMRVLLQRYTRNSKKRMFHFPLTQPRHYKKKINFWQYANAWSLIKKT